MNFPEYLTGSLLNDDEDGSVEFKSARGGVPRSMWETVSAFANTAGGTILLGVDPDGKVLGVEDADALQADIASALHETVTPTIQVVLSIVDVDEGRLIELRVPEAEPFLKPVFMTNRGVRDGAFKRVGSSDLKISDVDLIRFASERSGMSPDQQAPSGATLASIDASLVRKYRTRLGAIRPSFPLLAHDDSEFLRGLGLIDPHGSLERPKRAAILLFGTEEAILRFFPGFAFQILEIDGTAWRPGPGSRPRTLTMPVMGLVELASRVSEELAGRIPESVRMSASSVHRSADPVHVAVREGVVNALVHQDYMAFEPTQFRRYSDRLEMENPGASRKPVDHFDRPGSSPRNPLLARAFNLVGLAEQVGSGILTMISGFRAAGLTEPVFESDDRGNHFRVTLYWHNLATDEEIHRVAALDTLNEDEKRIVMFAARTGRIRNAEVRELTGRNIVRASELLRRLVDLGQLRKQGGGSATFYTPSGSGLDARSAQSLLGFEDDDADGS